jgi:hypothetical protein
MDLEKEMLRLRAATDDWAKALLVRRQERLIQCRTIGGIYSKPLSELSAVKGFG